MDALLAGSDAVDTGKPEEQPNERELPKKGRKGRPAVGSIKYRERHHGASLSVFERI